MSIFPYKKIDVNGKQRSITLYGQAAIDEQRKIYEKHKKIFVKNTHQAVYSYLPGKSIIKACELIFKNLARYRYYAKCDIKSFFPSINRKLVANKLDLLIGIEQRRIICGYIFSALSGISEGSPISPAISNIYLYDIDDFFFKSGIFYLRYSDDIIILSNDNPWIYADNLSEKLSFFDLHLNNEKRDIGVIDNGFIFLGFSFSKRQLKVDIEKLKQICQKHANENDLKQKRLILQGFKAYYQHEKYLPDCKEKNYLLNAIKSNLK